MDKKAAEIVRRLLDEEKETRELIKKRLPQAFQPGIKRLLQSLSDQAREHAARLDQISAILEGKTFDFPQGQEALSGVPVILEEASVDRFLTALLDRCERLENAYRFMRRACQDEDLSFHFTDLEDDMKKQQTWIRDHQDLVSL